LDQYTFVTYMNMYSYVSVNSLLLHVHNVNNISVWVFPLECISYKYVYWVHDKWYQQTLHRLTG